MRTRAFFAAFALGSLALAGCTATDTTETTTTTAQTNPSRRTYSQDQLQSSGEAQTGPALERVDPSVSRSRNP
jgi:outer membrane murein-binding lipoprotein Lpp